MRSHGEADRGGNAARNAAGNAAGTAAGGATRRSSYSAALRRMADFATARLRLPGPGAWAPLSSVAARDRDDTAAPPTTAEGWIARYRRGDFNERSLWNGLDALVAAGRVSSADRRELFWSALSWEAQDRLEQRCAYFHPQHAVWAKPDPQDVAAAEQRLARVVEISKGDEAVAEYESKTRHRAWILAVLSTIALLFTIAAVVAGVGTRGHHRFCFAASLYSALFWMLALFCGVFFWDSAKSLKSLRRRQQELYADVA